VERTGSSELLEKVRKRKKPAKNPIGFLGKFAKETYQSNRGTRKIHR
jgi:hypothetical protein